MYQGGGGKRARRTLPSPLLSRLLQLLRNHTPRPSSVQQQRAPSSGSTASIESISTQPLTALKFQQQQQRRTMSSGSTSTGLYPSLYLVTICVAQSYRYGVSWEVDQARFVRYKRARALQRVLGHHL